MGVSSVLSHMTSTLSLHALNVSQHKWLLEYSQCTRGPLTSTWRRCYSWALCFTSLERRNKPSLIPVNKSIQCFRATLCLYCVRPTHTPRHLHQTPLLTAHSITLQLQLHSHLLLLHCPLFYTQRKTVLRFHFIILVCVVLVSALKSERHTHRPHSVVKVRISEFSFNEGLWHHLSHRKEHSRHVLLYNTGGQSNVISLQKQKESERYIYRERFWVKRICDWWTTCAYAFTLRSFIVQLR